MEVTELFKLGLGLVAPWTVKSVNLDPKLKQLDIVVDFPKGSSFPCPECKTPCKVYDTAERTWRHLNFFEYVTHLRARQPRTDCPTHGKKVVDVPWARLGSHFTLLFEAMVVELARSGLTVNALARIVGENDTRLWRVLEFHVHDARRWVDFGEVKAVGVDETSRAKGHVYVTVFVDMAGKRVMFVTPGKDSSTVKSFKLDFAARGGDPSMVTDFSLDMSQAFVKGIREEFPLAQLTFDSFHVVKLMNDAVDEVRRQEQKLLPVLLKKTRYIFLKNRENHTAKEAKRFEEFKDSTLKSARAYRIREQLQGIYLQPPEEAEAYFKRWYFWATHSRLPPVIKVAKTLKAHLDGIVRRLESGLTNGLLEGFNSLIQAAKARARGFRSPEKMATVVYLLLAKLDFRLPTAFPTATHSK